MKRRIGLFFLVFLLVLSTMPAIAAQAQTSIKTYTVKVSSEENSYKKTIRQGRKLQLVVENETKQIKASRLEFSSSRKSVVSVDEKGILTAKKPGSAVITVKHKQKKVLIKVKVSEDPDAKTIKHYLLRALTPVGKVLYVWGGGWDDSTRKGLSPAMTKWFKSQPSNYNFHNYEDLSTANRAKGFDCSGYVGWCTYQIMHKKSGEGSGYTVYSGHIGDANHSHGFGYRIYQDRLVSENHLIKPGDIGYKDGHCFIVIGQCKDKSIVILQSTPQAGVQISGTATPKGKSDSQAKALAKKYMKRYYPASVSKYPYKYYAGNFIPEYKYFRWNKATLSDPDGYKKMDAEEILMDLFDSAQ